MEESTGEGGLRGILAELMQACASMTNFRPAAVVSGIIRTLETGLSGYSRWGEKAKLTHTFECVAAQCFKDSSKQSGPVHRSETTSDCRKAPFKSQTLN